MVAIAHSGAPAPIQQILLITAKHFSISPQPQARQSALAIFASEFKDPLPWRWRQTSRQSVHRQFHAADLVTLR